VAREPKGVAHPCFTLFFQCPYLSLSLSFTFFLSFSITVYFISLLSLLYFIYLSVYHVLYSLSFKSLSFFHVIDFLSFFLYFLHPPFLSLAHSAYFKLFVSNIENENSNLNYDLDLIEFGSNLELWLDYTLSCKTCLKLGHRKISKKKFSAHFFHQSISFLLFHLQRLNQTFFLQFFDTKRQLRKKLLLSLDLLSK